MPSETLMATALPSAAANRKLRRKPNRRASSEMQPQDDDAVWESLRHNNCSFMVKTGAKPLCKNTYNKHNGVGRCNRGSCPIANSLYATIIENRGKFFLHIKRTEGAVGWDVVQLAKDHHNALETIDKYLESCPEALVDRVKRLLTKMTRKRELALNNMRELALSMREMAIKFPVKKKNREVAVSEKSYESELLERLQRQAMIMSYHASKNPPSKMFAIGGRKRDTKVIRMDDSLKEAEYGDVGDDNEDASTCDQLTKIKRNVCTVDTRNSKRAPKMLIEEPEIEYGESDYELEEIDIEDLVRDEPLKHADYGDIDEEIEEVGTSDLPTKRELDSGKLKEIYPRRELDSGKSKESLRL